MSTTAVATPGASTPVEDITKTNVTYVVVREVKQNQPQKNEQGEVVKDASGNPILGNAYGDWKSVPESDDTDKEIAAGNLEEKHRQTFIIPEVNTLQGCRNLVTDDEEFVNIFSAGLNQKMKNRARTTPLSKDFTPQPGAIDLTDKANEKSERQRLTPVEKLMKTLEAAFPNFTPEQRQALVAQAQQMQAQ
jgi:hypothetical protein